MVTQPVARSAASCSPCGRNPHDTRARRSTKQALKLVDVERMYPQAASADVDGFATQLWFRRPPRRARGRNSLRIHGADMSGQAGRGGTTRSKRSGDAPRAVKGSARPAAVRAIPSTKVDSPVQLL